ncbi:hypothetical protein BGZ81_008774 [Podila clonocystis]|nr:hypothetical protein BGZ81_008774 [Podila clonocystis]
MDHSQIPIDTYKDKINNVILTKLNNNNNDIINNGMTKTGSEIAWMDAINPTPGGQPLAKYPGRKPPTIQKMLEDAKSYYGLTVHWRHVLLGHHHFGTDEFDPWQKLMYWWQYFPAAFNCPHDIQRVGPLSDGGKWICGMNLYQERPRAKCILYSFGISYETNFERQMLKRTDCEIFVYDASLEDHPRVTFKPYFIGNDNKIDSDGRIWKTLRTIMNENGHDWIDILQVDIEGSEYPTFATIMNDFPDTLPFGQLQMELYANDNQVSFGEFLGFWERLEARGVYPWWTGISLVPTYSGDRASVAEYSFLNTRGGVRNLLIQNYE